MASLPSRTASAMKSKFLSNSEKMHHLYRWVLRGVCGAPTTDAYTLPNLTLAMNFSAVLPPTVSDTRSTGGILAIAVLSRCSRTLKQGGIRKVGELVEPCHCVTHMVCVGQWFFALLRKRVDILRSVSLPYQLSMFLMGFPGRFRHVFAILCSSVDQGPGAVSARAEEREQELCGGLRQQKPCGRLWGSPKLSPVWRRPVRAPRTVAQPTHHNTPIRVNKGTVDCLTLRAGPTSA